MALRVFSIPHGGPAWREAVALRHELLRKPLGLAFAEEQLRRECEALHYAVYDGDAIVATAFLQPLDAERVQLRQMAVAPARQTQGIGRLLLGHMEEDARRRGYRQVVAEARVSALGFYLKLGYEAEGDVYDHLGLPHRWVRKNLI